MIRGGEKIERKLIINFWGDEPLHSKSAKTDQRDKCGEAAEGNVRVQV